VWTCEPEAANDEDDQDAMVWRRTGGSPWRVWKTRDLVGRDGGWSWLQALIWWDEAWGAPHHACAFVDADHGWVAGYLGEETGEVLVVFRTDDGGAHWSVARLGHASVHGALDPDVRLTFRDLRHGHLEFINPAQNRTGAYEHRWTFGTRDGGVHWKMLSDRVTCGWPKCD
jgi:photosystem II stability/assembly factor-like uncharacterized protein